jgi:hypothetical protein
MFSQYLAKIQNNLEDTWRISQKIVKEFGQIINFQASCHNMWVQKKKDPTKECLQLKFCVTMHEIHMEVHEWPKEWRVPTIPKIVPGAQTRTHDRIIPAQWTCTNGTSKKRNDA